MHHSTPIPSTCIKSSLGSSSPDYAIISIYQQTPSRPETGALSANQDRQETQEVSLQDITYGTTAPHSTVRTTGLGEERTRPETRSSGRSVDWSDTIEEQPTEDAVLQISGAWHWFLEGWIGDHSVDFLVDSGSVVTALSCNFYKALVRAGAPVGVLRPTPRRLRGANGSQIDILGCSSCVVSFLGLQTEFPILVYDLSTDAIIGTDTLGSILPHTLDVYIPSAAPPGRCIVGLRLHCGTLFHSAMFWGGTTLYHTYSGWPVAAVQWPFGGSHSFAKNTGLVVGRTLVDPSGWRVPVLVSNFGQETIMVEPFSAIGIIA